MTRLTWTRDGVRAVCVPCGAAMELTYGEGNPLLSSPVLLAFCEQHDGHVEALDDFKTVA